VGASVRRKQTEEKMPSIQTYLFLLGAIVLETIATSALHASQQFTRPLPTAIMTVGYLTAFYLLSHALKVIPVGIAYAIWSGLGIVLISTIGFVVFKQKMDVPALIGLALIIAGVIVVNVFSKSMTH
jgi:small multidrug resistance pump